ncbi:unnamed protein product [Clavelina lepadiformis]|uniref:RNA 3'-terminal phosphate cyclase-like protein n=1 Tax=Clavelina lepadiformis TaxID=159417 RepID=A0ABP0GXT9_CLALP
MGRLVLATLSGKKVKIRRIRSKDESPGLHEFEASLLRLLDKITNGTTIAISVSGTTLVYEPGILQGGAFEHDCNNERAIGYYLEILLCLAPFCKQPVKATLKGVTNDNADPSVDLLKETSLPVMRQFGILNGLELKIVKRGAAPDGGGEIIFQSPVCRKLNCAQFMQLEKIKRVRGMAYATRVSPQITNRLVDSSRAILNSFVPDVYIYTDHRKGVQSGNSPGFGLCLYAETTSGHILSAEASTARSMSDMPLVPEDLGRLAANRLMEEIHQGGLVSSSSQYLAALFMALGDQNVGKIVMGSLTPYTIQFMRHLRDFFGVMFKFDIITPDPDELGGRQGASKVLLTCVGVGFSNISKTIR